jgi:hypothetical protein
MITVGVGGCVDTEATGRFIQTGLASQEMGKGKSCMQHAIGSLDHVSWTQLAGVTQLSNHAHPLPAACTPSINPPGPGIAASAAQLIADLRIRLRLVYVLVTHLHGIWVDRCNDLLVCAGAGLGVQHAFHGARTCVTHGYKRPSCAKLGNRAVLSTGTP